MIECQVCGKKFLIITPHHLRQEHQMTPRDYFEKFPGSTMCIREKRKTKGVLYTIDDLPVCKKPECQRHVPNLVNKYCSRFCSMSHRNSLDGRAGQCGESNPAYKGGWYSIGVKQKGKAKERDEYVCQKCNKKGSGRQIHAHHKIPVRYFDDVHEANELSNIITLCSSCHRKMEWGLIIELYRRAKMLDEIMKDKAGYVSLLEIKNKIIENTVGEQSK